jgi:anti-anti-sigma regulatory factor/HAMP domain-containing protein
MQLKLTISRKLLIILTLVAVVSAGTTSLIGYRTARPALEQQSFDRLTAVREMKANQVEDYFGQISNQVITFSESRMVIGAIREFRDAFASIAGELNLGEEENVRRDLGLRLFYEESFLPRLATNLESDPVLSDFWPIDPVSRTAQYLYIASNPFEPGSKHQLDDASDGSSYSRAHRLYHPIFRSFLERFGYYDVFLIDHETGHIVYSVFKEVDFGTSLTTGPYRSSNFARAFQAARDASLPEFVRLVDFEPYAPSYNAPASFIASPIFDDGQLAGVLVFQMPVDRINDIMTNRQNWTQVGLGATGETYIVGEDFTLRNQSRFLLEDREAYLEQLTRTGVPARTVRTIDNLDSAIGLQPARTEGSIAALSGETGRSVFRDYRGVRVLSAFTPLDLPDVSWALMSEIDESEAFSAARDLRNRALAWFPLLVIAIVAVSVAFSRTLTRPIRDLSLDASAIAGGDLEREIQVTARDEIGELSASFESMRKSVRKLVHHQAAAIDALSTPLIPLHDDVVVMPLVGELDERRMGKVRDTLVDGLHQQSARAAILDLTGVPFIDEEVAEGIARAARAAKLVGALVVITGIQAETASRLVEFDLPLEGVVTRRTLQHGIAYALANVGSGHR